MDYEEANLSSHFNFNETYTESMSAKFLMHDIAVTILTAIGLAGNVIIIYIIFHYKRLQTISNIILANWAIAKIGFLLTTFDLFRLISVIEFYDLPYGLLCVIIQLQESFITLVIHLLSLMCVDWCLAAYWPEKRIWIRAHYRKILIVLWSVLALWTLTFSTLCVLETYLSYRELILYISAILLLAVAVGTHVISAVQKCRKKPSRQSSLMKMIPTVIILNLLSLFVLDSFAYSLGFWYAYKLVGIAVVNTNSVVVILMLLKYHRGFQACFYQTMKCAKYTYSSESLENNSQGSIINEVVHVAFEPEQPVQSL